MSCGQEEEGCQEVDEEEVCQEEEEVTSLQARHSSLFSN
jgi:hypothetical protein